MQPTLVQLLLLRPTQKRYDLLLSSLPFIVVTTPSYALRYLFTCLYHLCLVNRDVTCCSITLRTHTDPALQLRASPGTEGHLSFWNAWWAISFSIHQASPAYVGTRYQHVFNFHTGKPILLMSLRTSITQSRSSVTDTNEGRRRPAKVCIFHLASNLTYSSHTFRWPRLMFEECITGWSTKWETEKIDMEMKPTVPIKKRNAVHLVYWRLRNKWGWVWHRRST